MFIHFVGFRDVRYDIDERYWRAARLFGEPNFVHRVWDIRAKMEIELGDMVVFANGTEFDPVVPFTFDDSAKL